MMYQHDITHPMSNVGNQQAVIRFDRVTHDFGQTRALKDVTYAVPPGTVFALLGENGAGKTTSIRALLGMCQPNHGSISVLGMNPKSESLMIKKKVGYVPEQPALYDWMTVEQTGWFASGFYEEGYLVEFRRLAEQFSLPMDRKIKKLSKGMRAKVMLAVAMAHKPPLLILDEPTSGLDTLVRREFLESMVDLTAAGQSVFLSSHQIPEVERVADIVAIMKQGNVLLVEPLDHLKNTSRELIITFEDQPNPGIIDPGTVYHRVQGRQAISLIRIEDESELYRLQERPEIRSVDVRNPTLEDIFVAYMRGDVQQNSQPQTHDAEVLQ